MAIEAFLARFRGAAGIADSDWLKIAPGVSVITGRNNVGKSRILKAIGDLPEASNEPAPFENAPEARVAIDGSIVEADVRLARLGGRIVCPSSYNVYFKDGRKTFEIHWTAVTTSGSPELSYGPPQGPKQTGGYSARGMSGGAGMVPIFRGMTFLEGLTPFLDTIDHLVYIPPERPVKAQHAANPVQFPRQDGADLPQALYNHIANVTKQWAELEQVFFEMFPEVGDILTAPLGSTQIELRFRDKFAKSDISLDKVGTGLARMLHLISCVLLYPPGRVFLFDEPTTHLHPGSEKVLAAFIRQHNEHDYVISTHSPIFINAIQPDRAWLMVRDERGSVIQPAFTEQAGRRHVFQELGVSAGDIVIAERLLFVEGLTDRLVYPILLGKLGWDFVALNCEVIDLVGAEVAPALQHAVDQLTAVINVRYLIYLDGDKRGSLTGKWVSYLPLPEIEDVFLLDPAAIHAGFQEVIGQEFPKGVDAWKVEWPVERVAKFVAERKSGDKGKKVLIDLAFELKLNYRPPVYGPAIAKAMDVAQLEFLRKDFTELFS